MKKKKIQWSQIFGTIICILIGSGCAYLLKDSGPIIPAENNWLKLLWLVGLLAIVYITAMIQLIIHEAGHLLFGYWSGYTFSSFRILSFMWVKEGHSIKLRRLTIAGTGGQCLMSPPDPVDGKIPVLLYNLGGSIINILTGIIFLGLYFICTPTTLLATSLLIFSLVGLIFGILNGVPMRLGTVDNDGYNAYALSNNKDAMRAFWIQMKVNEQIAKGKRLKDMPDQWFQIPTDAQMSNSMVAVLGVFACNRLMDQHNFQAADENMAHLLEIKSGIVGIHRSMMTCDRMYIEMITENRPHVIKKYLSHSQQKFMHSMHNFPSVLRTQYAYALLQEKNHAKADKFLKKFNRSASSYPYPNEVAAERELIKIIQNL